MPLYSNDCKMSDHPAPQDLMWPLSGFNPKPKYTPRHWYLLAVFGSAGMQDMLLTKKSHHWLENTTLHSLKEPPAPRPLAHRPHGLETSSLWGHPRAFLCSPPRSWLRRHQRSQLILGSACQPGSHYPLGTPHPTGVTWEAWQNFQVRFPSFVSPASLHLLEWNPPTEFWVLGHGLLAFPFQEHLGSVWPIRNICFLNEWPTFLNSSQIKLHAAMVFGLHLYHSLTLKNTYETGTILAPFYRWGNEGLEVR